MNKQEQKKLIQQEIMKSNEDLFWILVYGLGGIVIRKHLEKLAPKVNIKTFVDVSLLRKQKIGRNIVYIATKPVFNYFGLHNKSATYTADRLLKSSLIGEAFIIHSYSIYKNETYAKEIQKVKRMINHGNMMFYSPTAHVNLMNRIYSFLKDNNICDDLSNVEYHVNHLQQRQEVIANRYKGNKGTEDIHKLYEDLYTLACKHIHVKDLWYDSNNKQMHLNICIFDINNMTNKKIADYIELSIKSIEEMLYPVNALVTVFVYSHRDITSDMESDIINRVAQVKEFASRGAGLDSIPANIRIRGYDSSKHLFGGFNVRTIL